MTLQVTTKQGVVIQPWKSDDPNSTQIAACPQVHVRSCPATIPEKWFRQLEQNQQLSACCREPRKNMYIEARFSGPMAKMTNEVDVYIMQCRECGKYHHRKMMGRMKVPVWDMV